MEDHLLTFKPVDNNGCTALATRNLILCGDTREKIFEEIKQSFLLRGIISMSCLALQGHFMKETIVP